MTEKTPANKKVAKKKAVKKTAAKSVTTERRKAIRDRRTDDPIMPGLLRNLEGVFNKIHSDNRERDQAQQQVAEEFAGHMQQAFDRMHAQLEERELVLDAKLKGIDRTHKHQIRRVKLLSIPVTVLSLVAVVYLFYVVRVMETSMTSMSRDMHQMTAYMNSMSTDTHAMTSTTAAIYAQMETMNTSIGNMNTSIGNMNANIGNMTATVNNMRYDVYNMSRTVSPAMSSINRFMP